MAGRKSFLSVPSREERRNTKQGSVLGEKWFESLGRRLSSIFTTTRAQGVHYNNMKIREMPGTHRISIFEALSLKKTGMRFFGDKIAQYNSRVFKFKIGKPSVIICDSEAVCESCCDASKVFKEPVFGRKTVNLFMLGNHIPSMFTNDFAHARRKAFMVSLTSRVTRLYLIQTLIELIPQHLKRWSSATKGQNMSIESEIMRLMSSIYSQAFFGVVMEHKHMIMWMKNIFKTLKDKKPVLEAYKSMYKAVAKCPRLQEILQIGQKFKMRDEETINEVLFAILFNGFPASAFALISSIGRLAAIDADTKKLINEECSQIRDGINLATIAKLKKLDNFVLEVVRLTPPAPFIFGIARSEFVMFSASGNFKINEGDVLAGSVYESNRDPEYFTDPNEFSPERFADESLKDSMLTFGGRYSTEAKSSNRKCPGQDMSMVVLKTCLLSLLHCDLKLKEDVTFTSKRFDRLGMPDEELVLEKFVFHLPEFWRFSDLQILYEGGIVLSSNECPLQQGRISKSPNSSCLSEVDI